MIGWCIYLIFKFNTKYDNNNKQLNKEEKNKSSRPDSGRSRRHYWFIMYSLAVTLANCNFYRFTEKKIKTPNKIRRNENFWINIIMMHCIKPFHDLQSLCIYKKFSRICVHWPHYLSCGRNLNGIFYLLVATVSLPSQFIFYANSLNYSLHTWHEKVFVVNMKYSMCLAPTSLIPLANVKFRVKSQWKFLGIKKPKEDIEIIEGKSVFFWWKLFFKKTAIANCHENVCYLLYFNGKNHSKHLGRKSLFVWSKHKITSNTRSPNNAEQID